MQDKTVESDDGLNGRFLHLQRRYGIGEQSPDRSVDLARPLWLEIRQRLEGRVPTLFRDDDALSFVVDRIANYTYSRLVVKGVQVLRSGEAAGKSEDDVAREFDRFVEHLLDLSRDERAAIVLRLLTMCRRIRDDGHKLTSGQKNFISRFADSQGHRCYLCGADLDYSGSELKWPESKVLFEIEHLVPGARGGSRGNDNLASSCHECNTAKRDALSYVDFPIETAMTVAEEESKVKYSFASGAIRIALLWRQHGRCGTCHNFFYELSDNRLFLMRDEADDGYHFLNVRITCGLCADLTPGEGVCLR